MASGSRNQEVMAGANDCSSSGLERGPNGVGQVTHFLSSTTKLLTGSFRNFRIFFRFRDRELQNDATTSSTGEDTYYSTAPQELWTEVLSKDVQDLNFVSKTQNNEGESSCVEVRMLGQSSFLPLRRFGGQETISFVEVHEFRQSDLHLLQLLAEGGQAHVYFAECENFSTPVVVKRLKHGNVGLFELLYRMEMLMRTRRKNSSAICRVFGAGKDFVGNVWVVMERMAGDLRTLIDRRIRYLEDGQMPFDYNNTITMMMHIAQGMEDLHGCDLIHADLKTSNILVTPVTMDPREEEVDGSQQASDSMYFYVKIGDFETSDGAVGTRFWRAPEVLQAVKNDAKPIFSPAADEYSYGMLCYELLTGRIPFEKCAGTDYDVVLSGQRPELPAHVNRTMKELLHACWCTEPQERPSWTSIIKTLQEELISHPPALQQPKRRARLRIKMERKQVEAPATMSETSNLVTSWEEAVAQATIRDLEGGGTEQFATWKEKAVPKILPEILPIIRVIIERREALKQDALTQGAYNIMKAVGMIIHRPIINAEFFVTFTHKSTRSKVLDAFNKAWYLVKQTWNNHVGSEIDPWEMGNKVLKPYKLLGQVAAVNWIQKILATSEEWQTFQVTLEAWKCENGRSFQMWKDVLQKAFFAWQEVFVTFHNTILTSPEAFIAWQAGKDNDSEDRFLQDIMVAKIYLEVDNAPKLEVAIKSIAWQDFECEQVFIRMLFLKNTIDIDTGQGCYPIHGR